MVKVFRIFGALFFLVGLFIIFNSFGGITGFAVTEDVDLKAGFFVGAWFVITAILLLAYRKRKDDKK